MGGNFPYVSVEVGGNFPYVSSEVGGNCPYVSSEVWLSWEETAHMFLLRWG